MVGIVVGARLGLEQTSGWVLGARGQLGQSAVGGAGENVHVNAATGNLIITNRDEFLIGLGPDSAITRAYNSQGNFTDDNGDNWGMSVRRVFGHTGTINTAGAYIWRTDWDGSEARYDWDAARSAYVNAEGAGAIDRITYSGGIWSWTDFDTGVVEVYDPAKNNQIGARRDRDGNSVSYTYNSAGRLSRVTTQDGGYTDFIYSGANLVQLTTTYVDAATSTQKTSTRTRYEYDAQNRLTSVTVDLSPGDNSIADGNVYTTSYTYHGTSKRVASISQSDGNTLYIAYETSGLNRVTAITQEIDSDEWRTTSFDYPATGQTDVYSPDGTLTTLEFDSKGRLVQIIEPPAYSGAIRETKSFLYNANGQLERETYEFHGNLGATYYFYGTDKGNLWTDRYEDVGGSYVKTIRTYNSNGSVLTETRYRGHSDDDGVAADPMTTRYVYDAENHLRFTISADGEVVRYDYTAAGDLQQTTAFTGDRYNLAGLAANQSVSESTMDGWAAGLADKTRVQISRYAYNFRGALTDTYLYAAVLATGLPDTTGAFTRTTFIYDQNGRLLSRTTNANLGTETFVYDGLGRLVAAVDQNGGTTRTTYHDRLQTTVVTTADGLNKVSIYNRAGELVSYSENERGPNLVDLTGWAKSPQGDANAWIDGWDNYPIEETRWELTTGPDGGSAVVIRAGQGTDNTDVGGGNRTNEAPIQGNRAYEFTLYFRKEDLQRHDVYFGLTANWDNPPTPYVENAVSGAASQNPYFFGMTAAAQQANLVAGRWYKIVGYVLPQGSANLTSAEAPGGVFDTVTGAKIASTNVFRWSASRPTDTISSRFFTYNDQNQPGWSTSFYKPEIREVPATSLTNPPSVPATQYRYDNNGRLRSVTDPTGVRTQFIYDTLGRKTGEVDGDGSLTEYRYDYNGRVTAQVRYVNRLSAAALAALSDASGNPLAVNIAQVRPAAVNEDSWTWNVYDGQGRLVETIGNGNGATVYTYDGADRLVGQVSYANMLATSVIQGFKTTAPTTVVLPTASSADRATRYFYDAAGRQVGSLDAEGYLTQTVYDAAGKLIRSTGYAVAAAQALRASGSMSDLLASVGTHADDIHAWSVYDGRGFLTGTVNGEGDVTLYVNDALGHVTQMTTGRRMTPPTSQPSLAQLTAAPVVGVLDVVNYDRNALGQVTKEYRTVAPGQQEIVTYSYDVMHRLVSVSTDRVSGSDYANVNRYDRNGRLIGQLQGRGAAALAALGANPSKAQVDALYKTWGVTFVYDDAGRLITRIEADGSSAQGLSTFFYYDSDGALAYEVNPMGEVKGYGYDALNRLLWSIAYDARISVAGLKGGKIVAGLPSLHTTGPNDVTTIFYRSPTDSLTYSFDGLGQTTEYRRNAFDEVAVEVTPFGTTAAPSQIFTNYAYDRLGRQVQLVRDATGVAATTTTVRDAFGRVVQSVDQGVSRSTTYDRAGRVKTTTDATGVVTAYAYDARGNVVSVTRDGRTTTYSHSAFDRTLTVTTPEGLVTTTTFDDEGHTLSVTDGAGRSVTYAYDLDGNLVSTSNLLGQQQQVSYDQAGRVYETTDATGRKLRYVYDGAGRTLEEIVDPAGLNLRTIYTYDALGRRIRVVDPSGVRTDYAFDANSRNTAVVTDPAGLNLRTEVSYDRAGNVTRLRQAAGTSAESDTVYQYDGLNRLTSQQTGDASLNVRTAYEYDAKGNVARRRDGISGGVDAATRYAYDAENRLTFTVDAVGAVTRNQYDADGRIIRITRYATTVASAAAVLTEGDILAAVGGGDAQVTQYVYDRDGRLTYTRDALGQVTKTLYDGAGNALRLTRYANLYGAGPVTLAALDAWSAGAASANDRQTTAVFDVANRQRFTIDAAGYVSRTDYDSAGRTVTRREFAIVYTGGAIDFGALDAWSAQNATTTDRSTRFAYDGAGRESFVVDAEGYATRTAYRADGQAEIVRRFALKLSVADGVSQSTLDTVLAGQEGAAATMQYGYDSAGRRISQTDALGVVTADILDGLGRVVASRLAYGTPDEVLTTYAYDDAGRMLAETRAAGQTEEQSRSWTYNGLGQVLAATDGNGQSTTYTYDAVGRVLTKTVPISASRSAVTANTYDAYGNLARVTDPNGNSGFFYYDRLDRLTLQIDPEGYATQTEYTLGGEVASVTRRAVRTSGAAAVNAPPAIVTHAADATTLFTRDKLDRLTATTDASGYVESYQLNAFGDRVTATNKTGGVTTYAYDHRGLKTLETLPVASVRPDGSTQAGTVSNSFEYDSRGNLVKTIEAVGLSEAKTTTYTFDKLDRMTARIGDVVQATPLFDTNTVAVAPTETIAYDRRGNVIQTVDATGARILYFYDDLNRKVAQVDPYWRNSETDVVSTLKTWTYDDNNNVTSQRAYDNRFNQMTLTPGGALPVVGGSYRETVYQYDRNNRLTTSTVYGLRVAEFGSTYGASVANVSTQTVYDAMGNVVQTIDGRGISSYAFYDRLGRQIAAVDGESYLTTWERDTEGNVLREVRYADRVSGAVTPFIDAGTPGRAPSTLPPRTADAGLGDRITTFSYDRNGRRLTETRAWVQSAQVGAGNPPLNTYFADATIQYQYDGLGNITRRTEATGDYVDYGYDQLGRNIAATRSAFTDNVNASVRHQTLTAFDGLGHATRVSEGAQGASAPDLRISTFAYGAGGRLASATDATGFVRQFKYDAAGRTTLESYVLQRADGSSVTEGQRYIHDLQGRVVRDGAGTNVNGAWSWGDLRATWYTSHGEIEARGVNEVAEEFFQYDHGGRLYRSSGGDGVTRVYLSDAAGRMTAMASGTTSNISGWTPADMIWALSNGGASTFGAYDVAGIAVTFNSYDNRGLLTASRQPFAQTFIGGATQTVLQQKAYNAFGEVASETDPLNGVTNFTYNTLGRLIETKRPTVAYTDGAGAVQYARPTETSYFDISGRLIATRNANGYTTVRTLLSGTGYGGEEALVQRIANPDGGVIQYGYDVFGDLRHTIDPLGAATWQNFDKAGRVITVAHSPRAAYTPGNNTGGVIQLVDDYRYDGLGRRIQHWNNQFGAGYQERTFFDQEGRVSAQTDFEGRTTSYNYAWNAGIGAGLGVAGGWIKTTTLADGHVGTETQDYFGRLTARTDLGGRTYGYSYDQGGRLIQQTSSAGQNLVWTWFNTGLVSSQIDLGSAVETRSYFAYDAAGRRIREDLLSVSGGAVTTYQSGYAEYDALGRMTRFEDRSANASDPTRTVWTYDLNGNMRSSQSNFRHVEYDPSVATIAGSTRWYGYDAMDRMAVVDNQIIQYDQAGNRRRVLTPTVISTDEQVGTGEVWVPDPDPGWGGGGDTPILEPGDGGGGGHWEYYPIYGTRPGYTYEEYEYTADGYLARVGTATDQWDTNTDSVVRSATTWIAEDFRDALGRVTFHTEISGARPGSPNMQTFSRATQYDRTGLVLAEQTSTYIHDNPFSGVTARTNTLNSTYTYLAGTSLVSYVTTTGTSAAWNNSPQGVAGTRTDYSYQWWDSGQQSAITYDKDTGNGSNALNVSSFTYNKQGHVTSVSIQDDRPRTVTFVTNSLGQVLTRTEADNNPNLGDPKDRYFYFDGKRVGEITNNGVFNNDTYRREMLDRSQSGPANPTPFRYGDNPVHMVNFALAYEALTPSSVRTSGSTWTVRDGDTLQGVAAAVWGDASLWYLIADANGLSAGSMLSAGQILAVPAKIGNVHNTSETFRPYDPNAALGDLNPSQIKPQSRGSRGCGVVGQIIAVAIAVVVAAVIAPYAIAAIAGNGATAASVSTALASGNLAGIGTAALAGGGAAAGAAGSVASQAFLIASGAQDGFNWKQVGLSALSAGINAGLPASFGTGVFGAVARTAGADVLTQGVAVAVGLQDRFDWTSVAVSALAPQMRSGPLSPLINAASRAGVQSLLTGDSFGDSLIATLPQAIALTIGNLVAGGIQQAQANARLKSSGGAAVTLLAEGDGENSTRLSNGDLRSTAQSQEQLEGLKLIGGQSLPRELWPEAMSGADGEALVRDAQGRNFVRFWAGDETLGFYGSGIWPEIYGNDGQFVETLTQGAVADIDDLAAAYPALSSILNPPPVSDGYDFRSGRSFFGGQPMPTMFETLRNLPPPDYTKYSTTVPGVTLTQAGYDAIPQARGITTAELFANGQRHQQMLKLRTLLDSGGGDTFGIAGLVASNPNTTVNDVQLALAGQGAVMAMAGARGGTNPLTGRNGATTVTPNAGPRYSGQSPTAETGGIRLQATGRSRPAGIGGLAPNAGGFVREFTQQGDKIYYRVFTQGETGGFLVATPPRSSAYAREALALPPHNQATYIQEVLVPHGTTLLRSRAVPQPQWGRSRGGAEQFQLLSPVPNSNFGPGRILP